MKKLILSLMIFSVGMFGQANGTNTAVISSPPPPGVFNQFVSPTGVTQQTNYCYWVVAVYPVGMAAPNGPVCNTNSNSTLDSSNYNTVTWQSPSTSVTGYWVLRAANSIFPSTGTTAVNSSVIASSTFSKTDQSNTLNSFTMVGIPFASAQFIVNNKDYPAPVVELLDQNNNVLSGNPFAKTVTDTTGALLQGIYSKEGNVTVAQINAGTTVVLTAVTGQTVKVISVELQAVGGAFAACTLVQLVDTAASPIVSLGWPIAVLTQDTIVSQSASGVVLTTFSWQGAMTASKGLAFNKTGSSCTTVTSMNYRILYKINS